MTLRKCALGFLSLSKSALYVDLEAFMPIKYMSTEEILIAI